MPNPAVHDKLRKRLNGLTPSQVRKLQLLHDQAKSTDREYRALVVQEKAQKAAMKLAKETAKKAKMEAKKAKIDAYTELGFDRGTFWQTINVSRGLCRICGKEAPGGVCDKHRYNKRKNKGQES